MGHERLIGEYFSISEVSLLYVEPLLSHNQKEICFRLAIYQFFPS